MGFQRSQRTPTVGRVPVPDLRGCGGSEVLYLPAVKLWAIAALASTSGRRGGCEAPRAIEYLRGVVLVGDQRIKYYGRQNYHLPWWSNFNPLGKS